MIKGVKSAKYTSVLKAGKQSRKFITAPHTFSYSAICDASRHIYIYRLRSHLLDVFVYLVTIITSGHGYLKKRKSKKGVSFD